jgi:4-diphosphocytidyl-2-C-methyl-D-erythritol kinase
MSWWQPPEWPAPAKLNLMLRILGRREDGYHLLQTVFQFLDFGDAVRVRVSNDGGRIRLLHCLPGVPEDSDLAWRAARLLQREAGFALGAEIEVRKRLPLGGGLGGGSSDAATVLVALNELWGTGLSTERLAALATDLGADVPVFVRGFAAWGEGVGERLTPVALPEPWFLVVNPAVAVNTGDVFKDPELTRNSPPITIADFLAGQDGNDCLEVVRKRYPEVDVAMALLAPFARPRLTGTGGCIFASFEHESAARDAMGRLPAGTQAFVARGVNRSPLAAALASRGDGAAGE